MSVENKNNTYSSGGDLPSTFVEGFHDEDAVRRMKYRPLGNTGMTVSVVGFGASGIGSMFRKTDDNESIDVVVKTIKKGVNYIDTAAWYGHGKSEDLLGKAFKTIPRKAFFIASKIGRYDPDVFNMFDFSYERTIEQVDKCLERTGLDCIDIMQIHDPEFAPSLDIILNETLPALAECKKAGKIRFVGLTGYPLDMQTEVINRSTVKIDTSLSYCHYSMNDTTLLDFIPFLKEKNVALINASPISMGLLGGRDPPSWHPAHPHIKDACKSAADYCKANGVNIADLAMAFTLANSDIPTTLVGSASWSRMEANINAVSRVLAPKEEEVLKHIMSTFFDPLKGRETWEGQEVNAYWVKIGKAYALKGYPDKYSK